MNPTKFNKMQLLKILMIILTVSISVLASIQCSTQEPATYYCPMHPDYTSDREGDCPICGMKLLKKKETQDSRSHSETNHLNHTESNHDHLDNNLDHSNNSHDHEKMDNHTSMEESEEKNTKKLENNKEKIDPNSGHNHQIKGSNFPNGNSSGEKNFKVTIEQQKSIGVKTALVESKSMQSRILSSGQVVYDMDLYTSMVEYIEALKLGGSMDRSFLQSSRRKLLRLGLSDSDIKIWARKNPEIFLSGRSGSSAFVFTQIFERDLRHLKKGQNVTIFANSFPGQIFTGKVIGWFKLLDEKNRSTQAWIQVHDPKKQLQPRMFTETKFSIPLGKVLLVPRSAVMHTGIQDLVYVKTGEDTFRPSKVTVGEETDSYFQILSGLEEGEEVVVGANFLLDSEARMQLGRDL